MNQAAAAKSYTQQSACLHLPVVLATQHINGHRGLFYVSVGLQTLILMLGK